MNNNLIPACIIGAGLFAVALKPAPQPAPQPAPSPQAEPVAVATASVTGPSEPVIVWYHAVPVLGTSYHGENVALFRAWSDGLVEMKNGIEARNCSNPPDCGWKIISTQQMACRTDINGDGSVELGDLLAVLSQWGDQATCPDTVQLQCGLGLPTG